MPRPAKVPVLYAFQTLNRINRGYEYQPDEITHAEITRLAIGDNFLVPVKNLRRYFANNNAFQEYKENIQVDEGYWNNILRMSEFQGKVADAKYARRFLPRERNRSRYKHVSKLGDYSDSSDSNASIISITPSNDECDETDVNLPLPVCAGIRRVCRNYDSRRRYIPYERDASENKRYRFDISYANA